MELQAKVSEYLKRYGIKKKYFASVIGVYPCNLSQWLSGNYEFNSDQIKRVEDFLSGSPTITM